MQKNVKFVDKTCTNPISTVVYFDENTLVDKINKMREKLSFEYLYIFHKGENGKKDHIHLLLKSTTRRFENIQRIREEYLYSISNITNEKYNIGDKVPCKPFVEAKSLVDWLLYHIHDREYLTRKNEPRDFYDYPIEDVKGDKTLKNYILDMLDSKPTKIENTPLENLIEGVVQGKSDIEIISEFPITPDNLYSTLKGLQELRKRIDVDQKSIDDKFYNDMYLKVIQNPIMQSFIRLNSAMFTVRGKPTNSNADAMRVLFEQFLKTLTEQDLIDFYFKE